VKFRPWWHTRRSVVLRDSLHGEINCDIAVVGAGVAGLHAALRLANEGADVVILEKSFCGGSTSGLSSGFLTPDSELPLHQLIKRYGRDEAAVLWRVAVSGVELIASTAQEHQFQCDLQKQDSLFLANDSDGVTRVQAEARARNSLGYDCTAYDSDELRTVHPGGYRAGVRYPGTWTLDPFAYCRQLADLLEASGVRIYEGSEVRTVRGSTALTSHGSVRSQRVLLCADKLSKRVSPTAFRKYFDAHTWLAISRPLEPQRIAALFPGERLQCWDSKMIYTYYRLAGDDRLLVGGGSALTTFIPGRDSSPRVIDNVLDELRSRLPAVREVEFTHYWTGGIDFTGDLLPLADFDPENRSTHIVMGCAGLPWAAWCGYYAAGRLLGLHEENLDRFFGWKKKVLIPDCFQRILGKLPTFTVNYFYAKR
jgi:gamma-glutamylputrescine oxidase